MALSKEQTALLRKLGLATDFSTGMSKLQRVAEDGLAIVAAAFVEPDAADVLLGGRNRLNLSRIITVLGFIARQTTSDESMAVVQGAMTRHLDVVATDASRTDVGTLPGATLDLTVGDDGQDNDFELTTPLSGYVPPAGALVYVDGTGWGGIVDEREVSTDSTVVTLSGRTWSGVLQSRVLRPDAGQDYLTYDGDANAMDELSVCPSCSFMTASGTPAPIAR